MVGTGSNVVSLLTPRGVRSHDQKHVNKHGNGVRDLREGGRFQPFAGSGSRSRKPKARIHAAVVLAVLVGCGKSEPAAGNERSERGDKRIGSGSSDTAAAGKKPEDLPRDDAKIERGRYLVDLMGCRECHSPRDAPDSFSGGDELLVRSLKKPFRGANITQDVETGIGAWTDAQIVAAVREGKRRDGTRVPIVHPSPQYNVLSDEDATALVAFLRSIRPVRHAVARTEGLNLQPVEVPAPVGKGPTRSDLVAYGGYLASLMTCPHCHTPFDEASGRFDYTMTYAGGSKFEFPGMDGAFYATNITPDATGTAAYSEADMIRAVREMKKPDGTMIGGPMLGRQRGWYRITEDDAKALAAFLKALKPIKNVVPKSDAHPAAASTRAR